MLLYQIGNDKSKSGAQVEFTNKVQSAKLNGKCSTLISSPWKWMKLWILGEMFVWACKKQQTLERNRRFEDKTKRSLPARRQLVRFSRAKSKQNDSEQKLCKWVFNRGEVGRKMRRGEVSREIPRHRLLEPFYIFRSFALFFGRIYPNNSHPQSSQSVNSQLELMNDHL